MARLLDTHCHFDFLEGVEPRAQFVREMAQLGDAGVGVVAQTVLPSGFVQLREQLPEIAERAGVAEGDVAVPVASLGFHPWWITSREQAERELEVFAECVENKGARLIGEIGLDFSPRRLERTSAELQRWVLRRELEVVRGVEEHCVLSIHAVRAATEVIDLLVETGVVGSCVVPTVHWFSGTSDELTRLIRCGGYVSINPRMLETKRGRAYAQQVPEDRLLLETDLPGETPLEAEAVVGCLAQAVAVISELRGKDMAPVIGTTQGVLYGEG